MIDVVVVTMLAVLPVMAWSIRQARSGRRYLLHKRVQLTLALILFVAVTAFEVDIRLHGWEMRTAGGAEGAEVPSAVRWALGVHLVFAVSTLLLWPVTIVQALRRFPRPPAPSQYSSTHRRWAWLSAVSMSLTAVTGWIFYYFAFVG
jgi:uncharacterized membrane protein YozB (DUF420 family)